MTPTKILTIAVAVSALSLSACSKDFSNVQLDEAKMTATGAMAWSNADRPQIVDLDNTYNYKLAELPTSGEANQIPWAGDYWATYKDSINQKVVGHDKSPAQKFGEAFGKGNTEDGVSVNYGVDSRPMGDLCTSNDDCEAKNGVATECAKRDGEEKGYCIETWTGICHAWAPAAILEKEPENPVTKMVLSSALWTSKLSSHLLTTKAHLQYLLEHAATKTSTLKAKKAKKTMQL